MQLTANSLLLIVLVCSASAATFDITSVSTCTQQSETGICTRWEQNGSVIETTGCFPAETELFVLEDAQEVVKAMSDIQIGDLVLSRVNGQDIYSPVTTWLHRNPRKTAPYIQISMQKGNFVASDSHNIALLNGSYAFTKDLLDQHLSDGQKVTAMASVLKKGVYAPLTESSNFYLKTGQGQRTLAHCYAQIQNPQLYEPAFNLILKGWELINGEQTVNEVHPAAEWMRNTFSFLLSETEPEMIE